MNILPLGDYPLGAVMPYTAGGPHSPRTAVNQGPGNGADYPLASGHALSALLLDFYLEYPDDAGTFELPLCVAWLHGFGGRPADPVVGVPDPVHAFEVIVADALGQVVFDSTAGDEVDVAWGTNRRIVEWRAGSGVARLVFDLSVVADMLAELAYADAWLDPRTWVRRPPQLDGVRLGLQTHSGGTVVFSSGFNVALSGAPTTRIDGKARVDAIILDGVPGAGLGRQAGCGPELVAVRRINRVGGDAGGNFTFEASDCFRAQLPLDVTGTGADRAATYGGSLPPSRARHGLELHNDCHACCECDFFVRTYAGVRRMHETWAAIAQAAEGVRDTYAANRDRWLSQLDCRRGRALQVVTLAEPDCRSFVGGNYCNMSGCCLYGLEMRFTFQRYTHGALNLAPLLMHSAEAYIEGSATKGQERYSPRLYPVSTGAPVFAFEFGFADPQFRSRAKMRACYKCSAADSLKITVTVHVPDASQAGCAADLVDVPADIAAIWDDAGLPQTPAIALVAQSMPVDPKPPTFNCECG